MLSSPNISSLSVIADVRNAISRARQSKQTMQINVAGIELTVNPKSDLSEIVAFWETEFENRKK